MVDVRLVLSKDHCTGGKDGTGPDGEQHKQSEQVTIGRHDRAPDYGSTSLSSGFAQNLDGTIDQATANWPIMP
jgi:hypothetical protein